MCGVGCASGAWHSQEQICLLQLLPLYCGVRGGHVLPKFVYGGQKAL
jgi:hypothetical protein